MGAAMKLTSHLRRRSGTPASSRSCKSEESEDLRERMMTMEAELRALRDELSNRSSLASNTSSQATIKEKDDNNLAAGDSGENTNAASAAAAATVAVVDNPTEVVKKEDSI